jgi:lysophospholipase L1-like esterase
MATVALSTTPTQIDDGTSYTVLVANTGAVTVDLSRGGRLRPGQTATVYPEGAALTAAATSGTGQVATSTTAKPLPNPSDPATLAARPEFTGTYAAYSRAGLQALEVQRVNALRPFHASLANRTAAPCDILALGDSITEGAQAATTSDRWVSRLRDALRTAHPVSGVVGGSGFIPPKWASASITQAAPFTITGSPATASAFGWGMRTVILTSGQSLAATVTGTSIDVWYARGSSTGTFSVSVDGGAATNYTTSIATTQDTGIQRVSLGSAGSHSVTIANVSGSVYIGGMTVYNGDESAGVRMTEAGHWGWTSSQYADNSSSAMTYLGQRVAILQPSLVIIELGTNDFGNSIAPATLQTNLNTLITTVRNNTTIAPSVVLFGIYNRAGGSNPWSQYQDIYRSMETVDARIAFFDLSLRLPDVTTDTGLGLINADAVHPTSKGHAFIADSLARFLSPR